MTEYDKALDVAVCLAEEINRKEINDDLIHEHSQDILCREIKTVLKELESLRPETVQAMSALLDRMKMLQRESLETH